MTAHDREFMAHALRLARRAMNSTDPNPRVGCVLVREGSIVGEGWHQQAGGAHAEIAALRQAGERAHEATAYVTLEPCCHHGRTPPCTTALIEAGVRRVCVAMEDPNPQVAGRGLETLRRAAIDVHAGVLRQQAEALNPGFIHRMTQQRPYVRCKLAMSLDGRTAMASGDSKWISSTAARRDVQRLRARSSAIMTGIATVLADDPAMTVRSDEHEALLRQPLRVVVDTHLRIPHDAGILQQPGKTLLVTGNGPHDCAALDKLPRVACIHLPLQAGRIDLHALLAYLATQQHINELLLEAGATLSGAMLQAGLVDELLIYMAPCLMGNDARGLLCLPGLDSMKDKIALDITDIRAIGDDWRINARVKSKE